MKAAAKYSSTSARHVVDNTLIEVRTGLNAVRGVREALLDLAYTLHDSPATKHRNSLQSRPSDRHGTIAGLLRVSESSGSRIVQS